MSRSQQATQSGGDRATWALRYGQRRVTPPSGEVARQSAMDGARQQRLPARPVILQVVRRPDGSTFLVRIATAHPWVLRKRVLCLEDVDK